MFFKLIFLIFNVSVVASACPGFVYRETCYQVTNKPNTKQSVYDLCLQMNTKLAVIPDMDTLNYFVNHQSAYFERYNLWLDVNNKNDGGLWVNHEGKEITFFYWDDHQPDSGNCVVMIIADSKENHLPFKWNSRYCETEQHHGLCASRITSYTEEVHCEDPGPVSNAYRVWEGGLRGSWVSYMCYAFFELESGNLSRQCQADGNYTGIPPICTNVPCEEPGPVSNAYRVWERGLPGSWVNYTCYAFFELESGNLSRQCQADGNYTGIPPICTRICGPPPDLLGAWIVHAASTKANYTCLQNWISVDTNPYTFTCGIHGWTGNIFLCIDKTNHAEGMPVSVSPSPAIIGYGSVQMNSKDVCYKTGYAFRSFITIDLVNSRPEYLVDVYSVQFTLSISSDIPKKIEVRAKGVNTFTHCGYLEDMVLGNNYTVKCNGFSKTEVVLIAEFEREVSLILCNIRVNGRPNNASCLQPSLKYGMTIPSYIGKQLGDIANYSCEPGFYNLGNERTPSSAVCGSYYKWSGQARQCTDHQNWATVSGDVPHNIWTDDLDETCNITSEADIVLNSTIEINMITVTLGEPTLWDKINVRAMSVGGKWVECNANTNSGDPLVVTFHCNYYPISTSIRVDTTDPDGLYLCEVRVFGFPWVGKVVECLRTSTGADYKGRMNTTVRGKACLRWNHPNNTAYSDINQFPDANLEIAENFCRNPNSGKQTVWCYTDSDYTEIEYCAVAKCEDICAQTEDSHLFRGLFGTTLSGGQCRHWHNVDQRVSSFHNEAFFGYTTDNNYCRNPGRSQSRSWCYNRLDNGYEHCFIPQCPTNYQRLEVRSTDNITRMSFRHCQTWNGRKSYWNFYSAVVDVNFIDYKCKDISFISFFCHHVEENATRWTYIEVECIKISSNDDTATPSIFITSRGSTEVVTDPITLAHGNEVLTNGDSATTGHGTATTTEVSTDEEVTTSMQDTLASTGVSTKEDGTSELPASIEISTNTFINSTRPIRPFSKLCQCKCFKSVNYSSLLLKNRELTRPIMIQKDKLSATVRKSTCAYDPRISSQSIGAVSVTLVLGTIFIIILADLLRIIQHFRHLFSKK